MSAFNLHWQSPHLSLLVVHIVACIDGTCHPLVIATSTGMSCNCNPVLMCSSLLFPLVQMQMGHSAFATVANTSDICSCYQCLLIVCRYSQSEFASVTFAMCMASSPVEGTVHGTKGSIKLHNAMHCPTKISVELSGQQTS